jgi:hypothetical protein
LICRNQRVAKHIDRFCYLTCDERSRQAPRLIPGGGETRSHLVRAFMPSEGIPAAGLERADPAQPSRPRDVPERCINRPLWDAVDRGKIPCRKIARHNIIDEGERLVGFEHPSGFDLQVIDGAPDLITPVDRRRTFPANSRSTRRSIPL